MCGLVSLLWRCFAVLFQTWADAFQGIDDLKEVEKVCKELKEKGMEFPMTDLDRIAPIHTPARVGFNAQNQLLLLLLLASFCRVILVMHFTSVDDGRSRFESQ